MRWCQRCVLPDTRPNLEIGRDGVCNACKTFDTRRDIDWAARERAFRDVAARARERSPGYDCLIPVSGGKDSTWQVLKCLEYGLRPLAVTWKTPARTAVGERNLANLVRLGVDHIDYQINPKVESRIMLAALRRYGNSGIPMHLTLFNIPLTLALRFGIPLVVWGENSAFEYGGPEEERTGFRLDRRWLERYGVSHGTTAADWVGEDLTEKDLAAYFGPDPDELERQGILAVFLGYYFPWDPETSLEAAVAAGFERRTDGPKVGYYDYADIDDDFISVHHYPKWYKFGFTRLFDNLSLEIRHGRLRRQEAIEILRNQGTENPSGDIRKFSAFVGISEAQYFETLEGFRNHEIWQRRNGRWELPHFLVDDWKWV